MYRIENFSMIFDDEFNDEFNKQIIIDMKQVRKIVFNQKSKFNKPISYLPYGINVVIFGDEFNQPICCQKNGHEYECECEPILPSSLKILKFGRNFNQFIGNLPKHLIDISFGDCFNKVFRNLPFSLKTLQFGLHFNKPFCSYNDRNTYKHHCIIPSCLNTLILGDDFNQPICCEIEEHNGCSCQKSFPDSIKILRFGQCFNQPLSRNLYKTKNVVQRLPSFLIDLEFGHCFDQQICSYVENILPESLKSLRLGNYFNKPVCCQIEGHFNCDCLFKLPKELRFLELGNEFNQPINNLPNLRTLIIGADFDHQISCNCEGYCYCQKRLPKTLITLLFSTYSKFNKKINNLPDTIEILKIGKYFSQDIRKLPYNLSKIILHKKFRNLLPNQPSVSIIFE